jgi:hypothetical protein
MRNSLNRPQWLVSKKRLRLIIKIKPMSESNFAELYKTWSIDQLLSVIDNPDHYEPSALEAAAIELKS